MGRFLQLWIIILLVNVLSAQHHSSAYHQFRDREIQALSMEEINGYLSDAGMGMAMAAELNQYPGPKHVLELAEQLELSPEQQQQTQSFYDEMHRQAVHLGREIVRMEKELDSLFAAQQITASQLEELVGGIARLKGELRLVHLQAHLKMREALTPHQIQLYNKFRGYAHQH